MIPPDALLAQAAFEWTLRLNRAAAYDRFYLALAETLGCELWTADTRLRNAADLPWVRGVEGVRAGGCPSFSVGQSGGVRARGSESQRPEAPGARG